MKKSKKYLPLTLGVVLSVVFAAVRIMINLIFSDETTGEYTGGSVLLYSLYAAVALSALIIFFLMRRIYSGKEWTSEEKSSGVWLFVCSALSFFLIFVCVFIVLAAVAKQEFVAGASFSAEVLLIIFGIGSAVFFFLSAAKKAERLRADPAFSLMYLFPLGFFTVRLVLGFLSYATTAAHIMFQLQNAAVAVACIYLIFEQRLQRRVDKVLPYYMVAAPVAMSVISLSAIPTLVVSLIRKNLELYVGDPLFCLVETAFVFYIGAKLFNVCNEAKEAAENEA